MLSYLLRQFVNSCGIFFRTIRAFFVRKAVGAWAAVRRAANFSRKATKVATASFQGAAAAVKKPTKREDYVETQRLFISKSFLILAAVGLVLFGLLVYYILWPYLLGRFFTARFYQGDPRLEDWSGRVRVYADEKKTVPLYDGTLESGVLQGKGREYDGDGLLAYEGGFLNGERSGSGACYDEGVLVYEGAFAGGVYEGGGSLYENGVLVYQGSFSAGAASGVGTAYENGARCYEGQFADGTYSGEGTAYYPDGQTVRYRGGFADGKYDGEGTEYSTAGAVRYRGGFAGGAYEGTGSRYLDNGDVIRAEFSAGTTDGAIQWFKSGRLWYDGGADDLTPDGFGTVYARSGKAVYAGELDRGAPDGAWLLSLTAEELREAFGDASAPETDGPRGFTVTNEELGMTVLCGYRSGEEPSRVLEVRFQPDGEMTSLLPWADETEFARWLGGLSEDGPISRTDLAEPDGGLTRRVGCTGGSYACAGLSRGTGKAPERVIWSSDTAGGGGASVELPASAAQDRMDALLDTLDGVQAASRQSEDTAAALLSGASSAQDAQTLIGAMSGWYIWDETAALLREDRSLLEQSLREMQTALSRGEGAEEDEKRLSDRLASLDRRLAQCAAERERASLMMEKLAGSASEDAALQAALVCFDPAELDAQALYDAAAQYASASGTSVDSAELKLEIKTAVIDLGLLYETVCAARTELETAAQTAQTAAADYARGAAESSALREAQIARNDAAAALLTALGDFTDRAAAVNTLSGGWLAQERDWLAEPFRTVFQKELDRAQAAAVERRLAELTAGSGQPADTAA